MGAIYAMAYLHSTAVFNLRKLTFHKNILLTAKKKVQVNFAPNPYDPSNPLENLSIKGKKLKDPRVYLFFRPFFAISTASDGRAFRLRFSIIEIHLAPPI